LKRRPPSNDSKLQVIRKISNQKTVRHWPKDRRREQTGANFETGSVFGPRDDLGSDQSRNPSELWVILRWVFVPFYGPPSRPPKGDAPPGEHVSLNAFSFGTLRTDGRRGFSKIKGKHRNYCVRPPPVSHGFPAGPLLARNTEGTFCHVSSGIGHRIITRVGRENPGRAFSRPAGVHARELLM